MPRLAFALLVVACGCEAVTRFDLSRVTEDSDVLCSDGIDNDGNGLTDCQDWKCLSRPVCCTMPVVVLQDDFESPACAQLACNAADPTCQPDATRWLPWGEPLPVECEGALAPNKPEACYDVGVLSTRALPLHPGLSVSAHVAHAPEASGRLTLGLTLQATAASGVTDCSPVDTPAAVVAVRQLPTAGGWNLVASFDLGDVGSSPVVGDDGPHLVDIHIGDDRRAHYALDGVEFAASPADQPLPATAPEAHLMLAGRGLRARVDDVLVIDGTQCEAPAAWQAASTPMTLAPEANARDWDSYDVSAPAVVETANGLFLYFTGCDEGLSGCANYALGRALSSDDGVTFTRDAANPRIMPRRRVGLEMAMVRDDAPAPNGGLRGYASTNYTAAIQQLSIEALTDDDTNLINELPTVVLPGAAGSWDDGEICCMSVVAHDGNLYLWYAGHSMSDPTWKVGLALSLDGTTFTKVADNPVLVAGSGDAFDGHGITDPEVIYDANRHLYRMWYTAQAFFGVASVGYAVSTDGLHWSKFPGNPVLTLGAAGLADLSSPAVHSTNGRLTMWLAGHQTGLVGQRIWSFVNGGLPPPSN